MAVNCGHVYHLPWPLARTGKLLVPAFINAAGRVRYFIINSERTELQETSAENSALVFQLKKEDYPGFLTKDCWLCCDDVLGGPTAVEIDKTKNCHRGPLNGAMTAAVRAAVEKSRLLSDDDKTAILAQWPN